MRKHLRCTLAGDAFLSTQHSDAEISRGYITRFLFHIFSPPLAFFSFFHFCLFKIFRAICKINTATRRFLHIIRYFRKSGYVFLLYVECKRRCYRIYLHEALFYETRVYFDTRIPFSWNFEANNLNKFMSFNTRWVLPPVFTALFVLHLCGNRTCD